MLIAHPQTPSRLLDEIWNIAHRLHSTCHDNFRVAQQDFVATQNDRLQPRAARLVNRIGRDLLRNARSVADLPSWIRTVTRTSRVPHYHFIDRGGFNVRAGESFLYGNHAKIDGIQRQERTSKLSDGRANC